jgi:hypothetical protein
MRKIYLDYNASITIDPAVAAAMWPFLDGAFGNPFSGHWASAPALIEDFHFREKIFHFDHERRTALNAF